MTLKKYQVTNCSNDSKTGVRPQMLCLPGLRSPLKPGASAIFGESDVPKKFLEDGMKFGQPGFFIKVQEYTPKRQVAAPVEAKQEPVTQDKMPVVQDKTPVVEEKKENQKVENKK